MTVFMRKSDAAAAAKPLSGEARDQAAVHMVCLALVLALIALACRIASLL
jgi:hypothetical protein